ncbi:hypothetical protein J8F10_32495 [Gemmata sp. G18]|uniref:Uncharacterized protein n=1 Tax=Gemmata palustris TaxID=2822762 RepID=A0ABS5C1W9_9BACT|nr:hypothetical protein [Gemmata palustris]MBP3959986.1 hypothetical protein [Gemmata palustris]
MAVPDSDVIAELTEAGARVEDYFLIGHEICVINRRGELMSLLVDDLTGEEEGEMHYAILNFLRRRGAKVYQTHDNFWRSKADE